MVEDWSRMELVGGSAAARVVLPFLGPYWKDEVDPAPPPTNNYLLLGVWMMGLGVLLPSHDFELVDLAGIQAEPLVALMVAASGVNSLLVAIDCEAG